MFWHHSNFTYQSKDQVLLLRNNIFFQLIYESKNGKVCVSAVEINQLVIKGKIISD